MLISAENGVLSRSTANPSLASGHLAIWLTSSAFLLGSITVGSGQPWLLPFFVALAYAAIIITATSSIRTWRDSLNPLCLICAIAFVRHLLPGLFLLNGAEPPDEVRRFFEAMKLSDGDWRWGHALAYGDCSLPWSDGFWSNSPERARRRKKLIFTWSRESNRQRLWECCWVLPRCQFFLSAMLRWT